MFFKVDSFSLLGIDSIPVSAEVHISNGIPSFTIVGLPGKAVNESRQRVRAAIINSGYKFPPKKIIINLSPADIKKEGMFYDLPIALSILAVTGQLDTGIVRESAFIGGLSLSGEIKSIRGIISMAECAARIKKKYFFIPENITSRAFLIKNITMVQCSSLKETIALLHDRELLKERSINNENIHIERSAQKLGVDFADIFGQVRVKRAMEIAVGGMHNMIMVGPPGAGKTMLAKSVISIMPELDFEESIEVAKIHALSGKSNKKMIYARPFRNPHHTISRIGLIGGGTIPKPGEISLAHRGILFLDEFSQFPSSIIEDLRQPLENKQVNISRNNYSYRFPCSFMFIVATNPCRCGYLGDEKKECRCSIREIKNYWKKFSGPIMDRIDIRINVPRVESSKFFSNKNVENSFSVRKRVEKCHKIQEKRYKGLSFKYNSESGDYLIKRWMKNTNSIEKLIVEIAEKFRFTARGISSIIKVSRTIADLECNDNIIEKHIMEAVQYRMEPGVCNLENKGF